jgi:hypothetical protein
MTSMQEAGAGDGWRKVAALTLVVAGLGLPLNQVESYAVLVAATVVIFSGAVSARAGAWFAALAVVALAVAAQFLLAPPRIEEGHNVFLPGGPTGALQRELPAEVYREMAREFDALYPPALRCKPGSIGCWQDGGFPDRAYAFSADGIWHKGAASRSVTALDFSDPVWLRLGFTNEFRYNWNTAAPDVHRADRDRRVSMGWRRWHLAMPWYEMIRLPAAYVGGELCWRGEMMWEGADARFTRWPGEGCRAVEAVDAGRRVFGIAIKPDSLAMRLSPPWPVWLQQLARDALALAAVIAVIFVLVGVRAKRTILPLMLIGLAVVVIVIDDASFLGAVRPFDGGDDGLFYDGIGRQILQHLLAGNIWETLRGGESVYWYGGPGLRYFRALEHIVFGESYLGYVSLTLLLPFVALGLFRRFLPPRFAIALALLFMLPIGILFGTTFVNYLKWASKGFADPAAYILFLAGLLTVIGATSSGPNAKFLPAFFGALLLALGIFMKPIIAPAAAVLLGGAGLVALFHRQWPRLAGLCIGFLPVFSMALHNWVFGHVFVLFSANSGDANLLVMPPSAYAAAARDLLHFDFSGLARVFMQIADWLSGPAESYATIPLNAAGVAILVYVATRGRRFDPWLRLIAGAALAQHAVAFFYVASAARYHLLSWFLTMLVTMVWLNEVGVPLLKKRYPAMAQRLAGYPLARRLASGLTTLQKSAA